MKLVSEVAQITVKWNHESTGVRLPKVNSIIKDFNNIEYKVTEVKGDMVTVRRLKEQA